MRNPGVVFVAAVAAIVVFCGVFVWNPSMPRFFPVEGAWHWSTPGQGPAMGWYGRTAAALTPGVVVFGVAAAGMSRKKTFALRAGAIYAIAAVVFASLAATSAVIVHEQQAWFAKQSAPPKPDHEY